MSGRSLVGAQRGDLGELAVLGRELGGRCDLHALGLLERALGEGREEGQPLDLDVEELAAHGALLGGRIDVEDVPAEGELAAVLDLVDALVAAGHELSLVSSRSRSSPRLEREAVRRSSGSGTFSASAAAEATTTAPSLARRPTQQRVERCDPQTRRDAVAAPGATRTGPRAPGRSGPAAGARNALQVDGQVARGAVVPGDHERGPAGLGVEQGGQQVRAELAEDERALGRLARGVQKRRRPRRRGRR